MTWTTTTFIFLGINIKHECNTSNGTPLGFITHKETDPIEFKATKKDVFNNTLSFEVFSDLEAAKKWILLRDENTKEAERVELDPNNPIYIYFNGQYVSQVKDLSRLKKVISVNEERVRQNWIYSVNDIQKKNYTFSHIKFRT